MGDWKELRSASTLSAWSYLSVGHNEVRSRQIIDLSTL